MIRSAFLGLILFVLLSAGIVIYATHHMPSSPPRMTADPAHTTVLHYADAVEHFDQDGIFAAVCEDSAPETVAQTFLAIGEDGRKATADALRSASLQTQASTDIKKVFSLTLKTPQGQKQYPLQVILLDGKWCIDEAGS